MIVAIVAVAVAAAVVYFDRKSLKAKLDSAELALSLKAQTLKDIYEAALRAKLATVLAEIESIPAEIVAKIKAAV